jgi:ATP-dependent helicase/nuclease subunit A
VGLFLRAKKEGIAQIPLHFIPLTSNFRSSENIVSWLNAHFPALFPAFSDPLIGAVPYSPATAAKQARDNSGIFFHPTADEYQEAEQVAELIQQLQNQHPTESIAILVRSRPQLLRILPLLSQKQIPYHAIEIESLKDRPDIQDLFTLTRALLHAADRIAWLALLRAPFCGLLLEDLQKIAQAASNKTIWEVLQHHQNLNLSEDGATRVKRLVAVLSQSFQQKGRQPIARWIEGTWLALSGPAVLKGSNEIQNAEAFFNAMSKLDRAHQRLPLKALSATIATLSASAKTSGDCLVQVMTIHKSKGLEFDHVILPGCSKTSAHDQSQLLLWLERAHDKKGSDLLLAPIKSSEDESDPIYAYLRKIEKNKARHELTRLLYVGITRAKVSAHCVAYLNPDPKNPNDFLKPGKGSFLELLWNSFTEPRHPEYRRGISSNRLGACDGRSLGGADYRSGNDYRGDGDDLHRRSFERLRHLLPYEAAETSFSRMTNEDMLASFKTNNAAIIGTLIHLALEKLATGKTMPDAFWKNQAMKHGLPLHQFPFMLAQIQLAIENTRSHEKGIWILQHRANAKSEMGITTRIDNAIVPLIIDRTFCDENDVRWIIDFKTSTPKDISLEEFLAEEVKRYTPQISQYAAAFAKIEQRPIRMALYFPLIPHYVEITGDPEHAL